MRVGHARTVLPAPPGTWLGGYADRPGPSTGVLDELEMHEVRFGGLAWTVLDAPFIHSGLVDGGWVSATHTHAGPVSVAQLPSLGAGVSDEARLSLRRLRLSGVGGQRSGARPRRTVPVDVLSFDDAAGRLVGLVLVVPIHPTVLPATNLLVSADLHGSIRRALAARLDGAWVVVATGAAGDVSTRPHRFDQTFGECERLGSLVAGAVLRSLRRPPLLTVDGSVDVRSATVALSAQAGVAADVVRRLAARLEQARAHGDPVAIRTAYTALQAAELGPTSSDSSLECAVSVAQIGPLCIVALGAEPYLDLAAQLEERLGRPTVLVGYTNGYLGYLPVRAAYQRLDYEVLRSPVAPGSAELVLSTVTSLIGGNQ